MAGDLQSTDFRSAKAESVRRGFRKIGFFSLSKTVDQEDMFSGGSDLHIHRVRNAFVSVQLAELGAISIGRVRSTGHDVRVREPHALTLVVPLSGSITIEDDFGRTTSRPGTALLAPAGKRATRVQPTETAPFVGVPVLIPSLLLSEKLDVSGLDRTIRIDSSRAAIYADIIRLVTFLHDELRYGGGLLRRPSVETSHFELLKELLLEILEQSGSPSHRVADNGSLVHRRVRTAEEYMLDNLSEICTIADVASELGISVRSLELAFRSVRDMSPHRYLASLRLSTARRLLLSNSDINSVTDACFAVGINHVGRFATAYRERYGESPSETLRKR